MKTLLIGSMKKIEHFFKWMNAANEVFEVMLIVSEDMLETTKFQCPVQPLSYMSEVKMNMILYLSAVIFIKN